MAATCGGGPATESVWIGSNKYTHTADEHLHFISEGRWCNMLLDQIRGDVTSWTCAQNNESRK